MSSASLEDDKCRIEIKFPVNVDIKDTYNYFVSFLNLHNFIATFLQFFCVINNKYFY